VRSIRTSPSETRLAARRVAARALATLALCAAGEVRAQGPGYVRGRVRDDSTGAPLGAVLVTAQQGRSTITAPAESDDSGRFVLRLRPGRYLVRARRLGYIEEISPSVEVARAGESVPLEMRMLTLPAVLEAVRVTESGGIRKGMLEGFDRRRKHGSGVYLDASFVTRRGHPPLPDLLRGVSGIMVVGDGRNAVIQMGRARRNCYPLVYLDGKRLNAHNDNAEKMRFVFHMIPGRDVEAIEIYRGMSETPAEFGGATAPCGSIAIWSRPPPQR
jgi:hypothetical protein